MVPQCKVYEFKPDPYHHVYKSSSLKIKLTYCLKVIILLVFCFLLFCMLSQTHVCNLVITIFSYWALI